MTIHKEGRRLLLVLLVVLVAANIMVFQYLAAFPLEGTMMGVGSILLFLLVLQFFRHPLRNIAAEDGQVLAPADGKIVVIEETTEEEYLKDRRKQISIFMSPLNVHVNRVPVGGGVEFFKYHAGKYLVAWHPKSSTENERTTMVLKTPDGIPVLVRQIAGAVARRIRWYVQEGQQLAQGDEFGFIKFGSRVDIFLPLDAEVLVKIGDKSVGGKTVLARLGKP